MSNLHPPLDLDRRSNWVRLRTLIWLRWFAVVGQVGAIGAAELFFDLSLPLGLSLAAVGAAVIANLIAIFLYPETKRLSEREVVSWLLFDLAQLSFLLFLAGGINNPFALLILVPVTISATALSPRSTLLIGAGAIALTTLLANAHLPLRTEFGFILRFDDTFVFGTWAAIVIGVMFLGVYAWKVASEIHSMSDAYLATQMALSREQKLTDLGGVVAAAAHELGTPLATIKMVSSELMDELDGQPDLAADAKLINEQADRCRDIMRSMGRAGKDDLHMRSAPIEAVIREAGEPHMDRGKEILIELLPEMLDSQPTVLRRPEIIHGLRNLVQNAVDFAETAVWVDADWSDDAVTIRIIDDGPGYPAQVMGRIGDPFVRRRRRDDERMRRPGYEGMGLGLFIAKTLLERTGAELSFANASDPFDPESHTGRRAGALVEVRWPRDRISAHAEVGKNQPIEV